MAWTGGVTLATGDLVTEAMWNNYLGVDGSIDVLNNRFVWLATSVEVLALNNQDEGDDIDWTDLDLTAVSSANAIWAYLRVALVIDSEGGGSAYISIRRNGDTPTHYPFVGVDTVQTGYSASASERECVMCGMDSGQVIEYKTSLAGTIQVDYTIALLGYIEAY